MTAVHKSRNASAGTLVEFTCATYCGNTGNTTFKLSVANQTDLPNVGNQFTLSFTAPSEHSSITITCKGPDIIQPTALLMIQGNINVHIAS